MKTSDFYYELPKELIAQTPAAVRSSSRLLIYSRENKTYEDSYFYSIIDHLYPGDVLVRNVTRVIPARIFGKNPQTSGKMEFLLLSRKDKDCWECLCRPAKRAKIGNIYLVSPDLSCEIMQEADIEGGKIVRMHYSGIFEEILESCGEVPLPPYITSREADKERYQTVYAKENGSAAAPTAGLHFTTDLLDKIKEKGVIVADVLLHVGLGTFRPVSEENAEDHIMHSEYYSVTPETANVINKCKQSGGRIVCVGTTSVRTIETVSDENGTVHPGNGYTNIYIYPGYTFKAVDALITNFHLPESTLLMLVSALCSREEILSLYKHAVDQKYRFFSFGDAMLIE